MHGSLLLTQKTSTYKCPRSVINMCASSSQISLNISLMNMTSLNTPAMDGYISKFYKDATTCNRLKNWQMIFSASASTKPVTTKQPQLPEYVTTNCAQFFLVSSSTILVLNTSVNATPTICYKSFINITPSPHIGRGGVLRELTLNGHMLPNSPSVSANFL